MTKLMSRKADGALIEAPPMCRILASIEACMDETGDGDRDAEANRVILTRLGPLVDASYALSFALSLALASSPPGELSYEEMNAITDLSYKILTNLGEMRKILGQASP
ncbi:MAG: hypothetical protein ACXWVR_05700 [Rhodoplanes sp.]